MPCWYMCNLESYPRAPRLIPPRTQRVFDEDREIRSRNGSPYVYLVFGHQALDAITNCLLPLPNLRREPQRDPVTSPHSSVSAP